MTASKDLQDHQYERPSQGAHTPGPWVFRKYAISNEDLENCKKLGIPPVLALSNDGQATIMAGDPNDDDHRPVARVECQTKFKRGMGYKSECAEREANAYLIAAAPDMLAALKIARIHAPSIRLAPERRFTIATLDAAIALAEGSKP